MSAPTGTPSRRALASPRRLATWCAASCLLLPACLPPAEEPDPRHEFETQDCDEIAGEALTTPTTAADTGVDKVAYRIEPGAGAITYELQSADGTVLGDIEHRVYPEGAVRPVLVAESRLLVEGEERASQVSRYRPVRGRTTIETVTTNGDAVVRLEWAVEADATVPFARLVARDDDAAPAPGVVRRVDGTYRVLSLYEDGEQVAEPADVRAYLDDLRFFSPDDDDPARRLMRVSTDDGLLLGMDATAQTCTGKRAADAEIALSGPSQTSSAVSCDKGGGPLGDVLTVAGGLLTVFDGGVGPPLPAAAAARAGGFGSSGLGLAVAIGTAAGVTTGAGAIAAIVAGVAISAAIGAAVDHVVKNNADSIINGVGTAILGPDEGRSEAISEFYGDGGNSSGDPHLSTFDGEAFDFHSAGEFVLARALTGAPFEVQVRQGPSNGACGSVAYNHALAAEVGEHTFQLLGESSETMLVDGVTIDLVPGDLIAFDDGTRVYVAPGEVVLEGPEGDSVLIKHGRYLHLYFALTSGRATEGLLGDNDGEQGDDFLLPPEVEASFEHLHGAFADAWRVDAESSLFVYPNGEGPEDYAIEGFPEGPTSIDDLEEGEVADATAACTEGGVSGEPALSDCVLDLACSGAGDAAELIDAQRIRQPAVSAVVLDPILLDGWVQAGDPGAGTWELAEDGKSVTQLVNGDPTVYVSPDDYRGVRIEGTLDPGPSDDDLIGFVFGYQAPLGEDAVDTYKTFVVTWKGYEQQTPEGMRLFHVDGSTAEAGIDAVFWESTATDVVTMLDTDTGPGTGWRNKPTRFSLLYTEERISVSIDGVERLSLDAADSPVPFEAGRFGFFNYSQPDTRYADFVVGPPTEEPLRASCTLVYDDPDATEIVEDTTWGQSCTHIEVVGRDVNVTGGRLSVAPGTTVSFGFEVNVDVRQNGALSLDGEENRPIVLRGTDSVKGHWGGVSIQTQDPANRFSWVKVQNTGAAGFQFNQSALIVTGPTTSVGRVELANSTFEHLSGRGLDVWPGGEVPLFTGNTFRDIDGEAALVPLSVVGEIDATSSFSEAGPEAAVGVAYPSALNASASWARLDVPYRFFGGAYPIEGEDTVLTLAPGTVLQFDGGALDAVTGALSAVGTAEEPILFTGVQEVPGAWQGLFFRNQSESNLLEHVEVRYAGASGWQFEETALIVSGNGTAPGRVTVRDSLIADSAGSGVLVRPGGTFVEENVTYQGNAGDDVVEP